MGTTRLAWLLPVLLLSAAVLNCTAPRGEPGSAGAVWPWRGPEYPPPGENLRGAAAHILSRAIRYDTSNPPGRERPLAEYLVRVARWEGLEARVVELPGGDEERAAAWAIYPGTGARRPVVLLSHLDVVPADPRQWAAPPFEGVIGGGFVVGRGALDAKGIGVVQLLALAELRRRRIALDRDVIFLATPDEERGGLLGAGALVRHRPELLRDAEFLLTEGGGILPGRSGAPDVWGVTFTEKSPCWLELRTQGLPGHGSSPVLPAAVPRLIRALEQLGRLESEVRVVPSVARMFAALAPLSDAPDRGRFASLAAALASDPPFRERFLSEPGRSALVRNTLAITVLRAGESTNRIPAEARAQLDGRLLPGDSCAAFTREIRSSIDDPSVEIQTILSFEAGESPVETELFRAIGRTAARVDPQAHVVPRVIAGFTDAHYFREKGIVSYGFVPRRLRRVETRSVHGPNERVSLDNLEFGVRTLVTLLRELAEVDGAG